ncbi:unnamed protein product [Arabis nemorensis]|uniref:Uncharacterized protein n=1 Tax=Arabis nemorensis TaxID=586526 RepID=A0A565CG68_9BRAS|nr:unnamed protein product [Arabis nemorensis]
MTRTKSKSLENKFSMFVEQLDREGLIRLDQFEGLQLTPSENSHLTDIFNNVSLSDPNASGADGTKWILFNLRLEARLTTDSLALEEA